MQFKESTGTRFDLRSPENARANSGLRLDDAVLKWRMGVIGRPYNSLEEDRG